MVKRHEAAEPQTDPQQFDVDTAMRRLGTNRIVVTAENAVLSAPDAAARHAWRRKGLLTAKQDAALAALGTHDGKVVAFTSAETFDQAFDPLPQRKGGRGRPLAIDNPWAAYVALGDVSDRVAADKLDVSVRTIENYRSQGKIPGGRNPGRRGRG
jgi:hypothetical protein